MKIRVKTVTNKDFEVTGDVNSTIEDLKKMVHDSQKINSDTHNIKLIYNKQVLDDSRIFSELQLTEKDYLVMVKSRNKKQVNKINKKIKNEKAPAIRTIEDLDKTFLTNTEQLDQRQIKELNQILNEDPTVSQFLETYPNLKHHLQDPEVLIELLRKINHPAVNQMPDLHRINNPDVVEEEISNGTFQNTDIDKERGVLTNSEITPEVLDPNYRRYINNPIQIVNVSREDAINLSEIRNYIKEIISNTNYNLTDNQLNNIVYDVYIKTGKNRELTIERLVDKFMENL